MRPPLAAINHQRRQPIEKEKTVTGVRVSQGARMLATLQVSRPGFAVISREFRDLLGNENEWVEAALYTYLANETRALTCTDFVTKFGTEKTCPVRFRRVMERLQPLIQIRNGSF